MFIPIKNDGFIRCFTIGEEVGIMIAAINGKEWGIVKLRFRKTDILAILAVALLAGVVFALFLPGQEGSAARAEIYQDGRLIRSVSLSEDQTFTVDGRYHNTVTVRDGRIAITASDCPGEDCVGCGWRSEAGRSIVCLPNGVEIRIVTEEQDVDIVVG